MLAQTGVFAMIEQNTHRAVNAKGTIDQIGRLERGLLAMRETAVGSPDVLDMIALIQYQEILRLRSELDAALGFDAEEDCDLLMSLQVQKSEKDESPPDSR